MARIIMLAGAHRSGKTTLAERVALGIRDGRFVKTQTVDVLKEHGLDMFTTNIDEAMEKQRVLFNHHYAMFSEALDSGERETVVFDRSLLDYVAHTLMLFDIGVAQNMTPEQRAKAVALIEHMEVACDLFKLNSNRTRTFMVEPLSVFITDPEKPREFKPSQIAINAMMQGLYRKVVGHDIKGQWDALVPSASVEIRALKVWRELDRGVFSMGHVVRGLLSM